MLKNLYLPEVSFKFPSTPPRTPLDSCMNSCLVIKKGIATHHFIFIRMKFIQRFYNFCSILGCRASQEVRLLQFHVSRGPIPRQRGRHTRREQGCLLLRSRPGSHHRSQRLRATVLRTHGEYQIMTLHKDNRQLTNKC